VSVHLTQFFSVQGDRTKLFDQADQIMDALMDLEAEDASITDSSVSVDAGLGSVTIEVYTNSDADRAEVERLLLARIDAAFHRAGIPFKAADETKRELQFA